MKRSILATVGSFLLVFTISISAAGFYVFKNKQYFAHLEDDGIFNTSVLCSLDRPRNQKQDNQLQAEWLRVETGFVFCGQRRDDYFKNNSPGSFVEEVICYY